MVMTTMMTVLIIIMIIILLSALPCTPTPLFDDWGSVDSGPVCCRLADIASRAAAVGAIVRSVIVIIIVVVVHGH